MPHPFQTGVIPAIVTPFDTDASVDWNTYDRYVADVAAAGPTAIAVNMAAGEATALERDEQIEAVRRAKAAVAGACPIITGVIATHTAGAVAHGKRLRDAGAQGVVPFPILPQFMNKPLPAAMVADYHAAIAEATALPMIAFQTAVAAYPAGTVARLAEIDGLVAIKDAAFDFDRAWELLEEVRQTGGRMTVLTGNDTFILEALLMGASGALIGYAATFTKALMEMQALAAAGQATEAYAIWNDLAPLARVCWSSPLRDYRARMKYILARQGVFPNFITRAPQTPASDEDRAAIDRLFEVHGLADARFLPAGH